MTPNINRKRFAKVYSRASFSKYSDTAVLIYNRHSGLFDFQPASHPLDESSIKVLDLRNHGHDLENRFPLEVEEFINSEAYDSDWVEIQALIIGEFKNGAICWLNCFIDPHCYSVVEMGAGRTVEEKDWAIIQPRKRDIKLIERLQDIAKEYDKSTDGYGWINVENWTVTVTLPNGDVISGWGDSQFEANTNAEKKVFRMRKDVYENGKLVYDNI